MTPKHTAPPKSGQEPKADWMSQIPEVRIAPVNSADVARDGQYVLYWMIAARRTEWNFGLDRAVEWADQLGKPLVVFEPLRCDYRWASDRLHRFVLEGMRDNRARLAKTRATYFSYVEPHVGAGKGLLKSLAQHACVVVTDDYPCFFLPRMVAAVADRMPVLVETVDSNGIWPMRASDKVFTTAHSFRRYLQKNIRAHLEIKPAADPLAGATLPRLDSLPEQVTVRWQLADLDGLLTDGGLEALPIDHEVGPATLSGGPDSARKTLTRFLDKNLDRYVTERNVPDEEATSELSPYLHFGHISAHEVFNRLMQQEQWTSEALSQKTSGSREGWWNASEGAEAFLDQLITWRELGFNFTAQRDDYDQYESLPDWARATLEEHESDPREHTYSLEEFAAGATHDRLWNAAANQLRTEGRLHNYLRMLWGKKILEWSPTPEEALETMIALNDRYAVDGRDPNSYSGICWVLGRYDRAWGPERPIFGKIRYMTSRNTARKVYVSAYLARYAP